nr:MAG TPA: hypothetical protein [Caudoviricetes sp.]
MRFEMSRRFEELYFKPPFSLLKMRIRRVY